MPKRITPPLPDRFLGGRRSWPRPVKSPSQLIQPPVLIGWFDGLEFDFLSNFHPSPIEYNGYRFPTVEHGFQFFKTEDPEWRQRILDAPNPGMAKTLGRRSPMRPEWDQIKYKLMYLLLSEKFAPGSELAGKLVDTFPAELVEGNSWGDKIWGVDYHTGNGENWLGELLMTIRAELLEADRD